MKTLEQKTKSLQTWEKINKNVEELSRWMCLYEAVNIIYDKAEEKGMKLDDVELHPLKIKDYIDSMSDIYHRNLLKQMYKIDVIYAENDE